MIRVALYGIPVLLAIYFLALAVSPWETRRKLRQGFAYFAGICGALIALIPLVFLLYHVIVQGLPGLNWEFLTHAQMPAGKAGGGYFNAIVGSLVIVGLAAVIGVPIGVLAGLYLSEVGKGWFANAIRFLSEVLTGLPSIIAGILGYTLIVMRFGFSALAGSFALSALMIPIIARVTEEAVRIVPQQLREASYGLGAGKFRTTWSVVLPAARSAIVTGVILAIARVGGETAPLIFTALGNNGVVWSPMKSMSALPLAVYTDAGQPYDVNIKMAVTGALLLVLWISIMNVVFRWLAAKFQPRLA
ncbi:MAG: phosphate ABC transporter permease PstA [Armatimonadetes bacterium]|nr:phosphate ABC transporter permease PstA [Armatimonadota bacterium]